MKEKDWFSRGIAAPSRATKPLLLTACRGSSNRETTAHQLIAVACSVNHALQHRPLYEARGFKADLIYSEMDEDKKTEVKRRLTSGELDCIVQVQMLGEGFDHPKLSVAAIFRPFRTLAPYIQFVGRILRVIVQNSPGHPDNYGHIVTHAGMNLDERLREFKLFESDDQKFWEEIIGGKEPEPPANVKAARTHATLRAGRRELRDRGHDDRTVHFPRTGDIIQELREKLESLGLDPIRRTPSCCQDEHKTTSCRGALPTPSGSGRRERRG